MSWLRCATLQWAKTVAIPADGVRAVAAVLRSDNLRPNCDCAILVHQNSGAYAVWKISAKTLRVSRLH